MKGTVMPDNATPEGQKVIERWADAGKQVDYCKQQLNVAECEWHNATSAVVRWMLPVDVKMGEKICVWQGDALIQVEVTQLSPLDGKVTIRVRGRKLNER